MFGAYLPRFTMTPEATFVHRYRHAIGDAVMRGHYHLRRETQSLRAPPRFNC